MQHVALSIDTLGCELDEAGVREDLLDRDGVVAAEIDFATHRVAIDYDDDAVSVGDLVRHLRFFGLAVDAEVPQ